MLRIMAASAVLLALAAPAHADPLPLRSSTIAVSGPTDGTPAAQAFCFRQPRECGVDLAEPAIIALTQDLFDLLAQVNRETNERIEQVTDQDHFGVVDRWDFPTDGKGDCEDIQLEKRRLLRLAGLPQRAMRMAVVFTASNEGHAVLIVRTDSGDLVLDNMRGDVLPWRSTGYRFVKRESSDAWGWVMLDPEQAEPLLTARAEAR